MKYIVTYVTFNLNERGKNRSYINKFNILWKTCTNEGFSVNNVFNLNFSKKKKNHMYQLGR